MPAPSVWDLMTLPMRVASRAADLVSGGSVLNLDTEHTVPGNDPSRWADLFVANPTAVSPFTVGATRQAATVSGRPFPGGPQIGITVIARRDGKLADGRRQTVLEVRYSGDFDGPGRITVTQTPGRGLVVRDQWLGVRNHSLLPSRAAQLGHPLVAGLGFEAIGKHSTAPTRSKP